MININILRTFNFTRLLKNWKECSGWISRNFCQTKNYFRMKFRFIVIWEKKEQLTVWVYPDDPRHTKDVSLSSASKNFLLVFSVKLVILPPFNWIIIEKAILLVKSQFVCWKSLENKREKIQNIALFFTRSMQSHWQSC